jgi:hypothetical protein
MTCSKERGKGGVGDLIFPAYAIGRMRQRSISEDDVSLTVEDADDEPSEATIARSTPG